MFNFSWMVIANVLDAVWLPLSETRIAKTNVGKDATDRYEQAFHSQKARVTQTQTHTESHKQIQDPVRVSWEGGA